MYGLNPSITGKDNPNSPYFESPCDYCRQKCSTDCPYNPDADDDKMPEDEIFDPERMIEAEQENL